MTQRNKTWSWFSKMIRLKYADWKGYVKCFTCGELMFWKEAQAGHFQGGRRNAVLFDENGVKVQCYKCNVCNHGEQFIFGENLKLEIGESEVKKLIRNKSKTVKYSLKELEAMEKVYKIKAEMFAKEKGIII